MYILLGKRYLKRFIGEKEISKSCEHEILVSDLVFIAPWLQGYEQNSFKNLGKCSSLSV